MYSVDPSTLNADSQIIELLSYSNNVYVDYAELRVYPQNDGFIYKNLAAVASENGRNILTAEANKEYTYTVTAKNDGIYSVGLCYDSNEKVGIKLNGRGYTLPSSTCLTAHGFAALNLKKGENTITLSADTECTLNYIVFCRADISVTNGDEKEITKYENGLLTVNCGLSGLIDGRELMLIAAVYKDKTLIDTKMKSSTITNANYTITMPIEVSGGDTLKVYLWDNANTLIPYSDVKIYDKEANQ